MENNFDVIPNKLKSLLFNLNNNELKNFKCEINRMRNNNCRTIFDFSKLKEPPFLRIFIKLDHDDYDED